jgi:hypothetical protein
MMSALILCAVSRRQICAALPRPVLQEITRIPPPLALLPRALVGLTGREEERWWGRGPCEFSGPGPKTESGSEAGEALEQERLWLVPGLLL